MLDVRYARTVKNLQHVLIIGLERIGQIHLSLKGLDPFATNNKFRITLPYISTVEESEKVDALSVKLDAVQKEVQLLDQLDPDKKLLDRYELIHAVLEDLGYSEEQISRVLQSKEVLSAMSDAIGTEG